MKQQTAIYILFFFFLSFPALVNAQALSMERTTNTSKKAKAAPNKEFKKQKIQHIIKSDTRKFLFGNKCAEDETLKMGFVYVAMPKGRPGNKNEFNRNLQNLGAKTSILLKNGPFWKVKLNKRIKRCRQQTGDFVG
jgi:hypothetical protein